MLNYSVAELRSIRFSAAYRHISEEHMSLSAILARSTPVALIMFATSVSPYTVPKSVISNLLVGSQEETAFS